MLNFKKEDLVKIFYCALVVEYRNMCEGFFRTLITYQTKNQYLIKYWNNGVNVLSDNMSKVLRTIENILEEFIGKIFVKLKIEFPDDIEDFNKKMDIVVGNSEYVKYLEENGILDDSMIPEDNEIEEGVTISSFLTHLHYIHYCQIIDKYYPHLVADSDTEDLFLLLAIMSDKYFAEMWDDVTVNSVERFKETGSIN